MEVRVGVRMTEETEVRKRKEEMKGDRGPTFITVRRWYAVCMPST